jgi:putative addiction module component (TIGR02574 family)
MNQLEESLMPVEIPLETLTVAEKVRLLESVWDSLCGEPGDVKSPDWHREVLEARQRRLDEGLATVSPWSEAKARLLQVGK